MNCQKLLAAFAVALCASTSVALGSGSELGALKRAYNDASKIVDREQPYSGFEIGGSSDDANALEQQWTLATQWLSISLSGQAKLDDKQVSTTLHNLDSKLDADILNLAPDIYLIAIKRGEIGTIFALGKIGDRFESDWNIRQVAPLEINRFPGLAAWRAASASEKCRAQQADFGGRCGPLFGYFGHLSNDESGRPRFYVVGEYGQIAGATVGLQLSIWTWDKNRAIPQYVKNYSQVLEVSNVPTLQGDTLHVPTKEEFVNFFSCGDCLGRQTDRSIRIGPARVHDLGSTSTMPELDALDLLVNRLAHRRPSAELAAKDVAVTIAEIIKDTKATLASYRNLDSNYFSLGMLMNGEVEPDPKAPRQTLLCFSTDDLGDHFLFTLVPQRKGYFISKVRNLGSLDTPDKLCSRRAIY